MFGFQHRRVVEGQLAGISRKLDLLYGQGLALGKIMSAATDRMNAAIAAQTTIDAGFKAAMDGITAQLRELATNADGASPDQLNAFAAEIEANNAVASAALQEGIAPVAVAPPTTAPPASSVPQPAV